MHGQKTHKGSFPSIFRNTSSWGNKKTAGSRGSLTLRQMTAHSLDIWFLISVFCLLISVLCVLVSDIWFLFSGFCYLFFVFWFLLSGFWFLISVSCFLSSGVCSLISAFWYLSSVFWFLLSGFCLFSYHILHWVKKTAHLINKICCPYCQAFSGLRIDLSAFSFSGFRQPLSVFIRQTNHSALRTWWDACR